jgi:dTDP-4-dehydrorhamnose 3,5-epimerase
VIFHETPLAGVVLVELEQHADERGWFARTLAADELAAAGLEPSVVQCSTSYNEREGTLRGMHLQAPPHGECKLVRCTRGAIFDVGVDLRPGSPTFRRWHGVELTPDNGRMLYLADGIGHGFQTLAPATEVAYWISAPYVPDAARGVRWDDPAFGIEWPEAPPGGRTISERDATYPDFR